MSGTYIIKKNQTKTTKWSGGETTELFIYPESADFKKLDFDFRLSTASIDVSESDFTSLPNINRTLLLLDGKLKLQHEGKHNIELSQFDTDKFNGSWKTKSYGKAIDFNFMSSKTLNEDLNVLNFHKGSQFTDRNLHSFSAIYVYKGEIETKEGHLLAGDIWVNFDTDIADFNVLETSTLIHIALDL